MDSEKILLICSGGMDSTVALYEMIKIYGVDKIGVLSFDYGSKHNKKELDCIKKTTNELKVNHTIINLDFIKDHFKSNLLEGQGDIPEGHYEDENMKQTVVPFRNGIMLAIAAGYAESHGYDIIVLGNHKGDHAIYPDCRISFIKSMNEAIVEGTYNNVRIYSPYCNMSKSDIASVGDTLDVNWKNTWSCYKGKDKHCGKCTTCIERKEAFMEAGLNDPTEYEE